MIDWDLVKQNLSIVWVEHKIEIMVNSTLIDFEKTMDNLNTITVYNNIAPNFRWYIDRKSRTLNVKKIIKSYRKFEPDFTGSYEFFEDKIIIRAKVRINIIDRIVVFILPLILSTFYFQRSHNLITSIFIFIGL